MDELTPMFTPRIDIFKPPYAATPKKNLIDLWVRILSRQKIAIFGGGYDIHKANIIRTIAWYLRSNLLGADKDESAGYPYREWLKLSTELLVETIQQNQVPTIYILPQATPQSLGVNLNGLLEVLNKREHYIIISTDIHKTAWYLGESNDSLWIDIDTDNVFGQKELTNILITALNNRREQLPREIFQNPLHEKSSLIESSQKNLDDIAKILASQNNINVFVQYLCSNRKITEGEFALLFANRYRNHSHMIKDWFYYTLKPREQMLALALTLFDGLFDDQFFASLRILVENAWHQRDGSLKGLDLIDLLHMGAFFSTVKSRSGSDKIESVLPNQRKILLDIIKNTYPMQIRSALSTLIDLVQRSNKYQKELEKSLYGTETRRKLIKGVISDILSEIELVIPGIIEEHLLDLAVDDDEYDNGRKITAGIMARWFQIGEEDLFLKTINRWLMSKDIEKIVNEIIKNKNLKRSSHEYIYATLSMAIGYCIVYSPRDEIKSQIVLFIQKMSSNKSHFIIKRFIRYTLRNSLKYHFLQLKSYFLEIIEYPLLKDSLSEILAATYDERPNDIANTLSEWYQQCMHILEKEEKIDNKYSFLLEIVIKTYGLIGFKKDDIVSVGEVIKRIKPLMGLKYQKKLKMLP